MPKYTIFKKEAETRFGALDRHFSSKEAFDAFEPVFLDAYEKIFNSLSRAASVKESGGREDAELSLSKWVDPSHITVAAIRKKSALNPGLIQAALNVLESIDEEFIICFDAYPTTIYISKSGDIFITTGSNSDDLNALGIS